MRSSEIAPTLRASQFHTVHPIQINIDPHPLLRIAAFSTSFPVPLGDLATPPALTDALRLDAPAPLQRDEAVRGAVRDLLRHGGYKPTGRGKPASEYLVRAATEGALGSINAAVDACNVGLAAQRLPDQRRGPRSCDGAVPHRRSPPQGTSYVFNASGQEIDVAGLLCLFDAEGACANAVRDSQRTKTRAETRSTLSVVWGCAGFEERLANAARWYRELLGTLGATTTDAVISSTGAVA